MSATAMDNGLHGRRALVTGGSRGMGAAIALALARAGADVAITYASRADQAAGVCEQVRAMGRRAVALRAALQEPGSPGTLAREASEALGGVDVLVHNAGVGEPRKLESIDEAAWDETHAINLKAPFLLTQALLPGMRERRFGRVIFVASTAAQTGGVVGPHYAASKAGLIGLAHSYAALLAKEGITSNAIAMALIDTDMLAKATHVKPEIVPVGRFGHVDEIAAAALFLAQNGYVTGQTLNVNGGVYFS